MSITVNADNVVQLACQSTGCRCVPIASKELPVSIKLAVEKDMEENSYFGKYGSVVLPVETIDTLKVKCDFIVNQNGMSISIRCDNLKMYGRADETNGLDGRITRWKNGIGIRIEQILFRKTYIKKLTKYTLKDYESVIKNIHKDIKVMKFDKLNGVLTTPENKHPKEAPYIWGHYDLTNLPCDEEHPEECSVCLDTTKTTTACGHKLCVACWSSIKRNGHELPCPICREDLFQTRKVYGDDAFPVGHNDSDSEDYDETEDWSDSDDESEDDSDIQYAQFPEPIEFPSVRHNTVMDMY
jgi:Zinc finger, C3HC4 type (RING finger)